MRGDELSQLWVPGAELLEDGLQHLGLLLDNLAELLELSIVPEEVEVTQVTTSTALAPGCGCGCGGRGGSSLIVATAP